MLLVDDDQPQSSKFEFVLDQRLGADEGVESTAGGVRVDARSLFAPDAARQQANGRSTAQNGLELRPGSLEQAAPRCKMLLAQDLGRPHPRTLVAVGQRIAQA